MGRAERRMAQKRAKKGPQHPGGRPISARGAPRSTDVVPRDVLLTRLSEVPVFGIQSNSGLIAAADGAASLFLSVKEAETACRAMKDSSLRVEGVPLSDVYYDKKTRLKACDGAVAEAQRVPPSGRLVPLEDVRVPLFCIDGLATTDKDTGVSSVPVFFSKKELLGFAGPVYGAAAAEAKVLVTDLGVVVNNMLQGPAGPLKDAKFFAADDGCRWMDEQAQKQKDALFPTAAGAPPEPPRGFLDGLFPR